MGSWALLAVFLVHALWSGAVHLPAATGPTATATSVTSPASVVSRASATSGASVTSGASAAGRGSAGYPYARAACEFGSRGGAYCTNPRDQGDQFNWGYWKGRAFDASDPWGYEYRNCTSYVAWRLARARVPAALFTYLGDATQWISDVRGERDVVVNQTASPGAVAVWSGAGVGHVAWVVSVRQGRVTVADYNYDGTGDYAQHVIGPKPSGYIHFP